VLVALIEGGTAPGLVAACTVPFGPGSADACNINATCLQPSPERRSVMRILAPGEGGQIKAGSGVLINNGFGIAGAPFIVTAAHLIDCDGDGEIEPAEGQEFQQNVEFFFALESSCEGGPPSEPYVVQGATVLEIDVLGDLALLQAQVSAADLLAHAQPYYAGWDFFGEPLPLHVHTIHHPCSDVRMLSAGEAPDDVGDFIRLQGLTCGGLQPGSSGGPLFDTGTRNLIGALSGISTGDGGVSPAGDLCAGEAAEVFFGRFTDFGFQWVSALQTVPPFDPMTKIVDAWEAIGVVVRDQAG